MERALKVRPITTSAISTPTIPGSPGQQGMRPYLSCFKYIHVKVLSPTGMQLLVKVNVQISIS